MNTNIDTDGMIAFIRRLNKKQEGKYHYKKVYLYTLDNELVRVFDTTDECANYFGYPREYLYHNIKYRKKIRHRKEKKWYVIKRQ